MLKLFAVPSVSLVSIGGIDDWERGVMGCIKRLSLLAHMQKYPEKLYFEGLAEQVNPPMQLQPQYLPIYFGNVCLRFLPVFDIVIHRFLELLPVSKSLETLLDHLGGLYKFHGEENDGVTCPC